MAGALLIGTASAAAAEPGTAQAETQDVAILRALLGVAPPPAAEPAPAAEPVAPALPEPVMARLSKLAAARQTSAEQTPPADGQTAAEQAALDSSLAQAQATSTPAEAAQGTSTPAPAAADAGVVGTPGFQLSRALAAAKNASDRLLVAAP
ncbi:MAG TPA: hypothetical protein VEC57_10460 [Candidatus Limnocylindrales bacterium]|nr:hypothetical protein [Candidatus Limnocylindrales bacterium]